MINKFYFTIRDDLQVKQLLPAAKSNGEDDFFVQTKRRKWTKLHVTRH